mmetsp:Transcript_27187/g.59863  ORF Transcript_27187/g.59863 Transcript_27187/m.59863 type:complete len:93 (+) Transcript_27187:503-781(+)
MFRSRPDQEQKKKRAVSTTTTAVVATMKKLKSYLRREIFLSVPLLPEMILLVLSPEIKDEEDAIVRLQQRMAMKRKVKSENNACAMHYLDCN